MIDIKELQQKYLANVKRLEAMPIEEKNRNANSHVIGVVDDRYGCVECEISPHSAWKNYCPATADRDLAYARSIHPAGKALI
jgi:hypothetical protein